MPLREGYSSSFKRTLPHLSFNMPIFLKCFACFVRSPGIITGISDLDPIRWPGSKWRCLLVSYELCSLKKSLAWFERSPIRLLLILYISLILCFDVIFR